MKIIFLIVSILISSLGFYIDHLDRTSWLVKLIDKDHYFIMRSLDNFNRYPKAVIEKDDLSLKILLKYYWPDLSPADVNAIGRTTMIHFSGDTSIESDFKLIINSKDDAIKDGLSYTLIRQKEIERFDKKIGRYGEIIFWIGIVLLFIIELDWKLRKILRNKRKIKNKKD